MVRNPRQSTLVEPVCNNKRPGWEITGQLLPEGQKQYNVFGKQKFSEHQRKLLETKNSWGIDRTFPLIKKVAALPCTHYLVQINKSGCGDACE